MWEKDLSYLRFNPKKRMPPEQRDLLIAAIYDKNIPYCTVPYSERVNAIRKLLPSYLRDSTVPNNIPFDELGSFLKAAGISLEDFYRIIGSDRYLDWPDEQSKTFCTYLEKLDGKIDMKALGRYVHSLLADYWQETDRSGAIARGEFYSKFVLSRTDLARIATTKKERFDRLLPEEQRVISCAASKTVTMEYYPALAYLFRLPLHWLSSVPDDVLLYTSSPDIEYIMDCYCRLNDRHRDYLSVLVKRLMSKVKKQGKDKTEHNSLDNFTTFSTARWQEE